MRNIIQDIETLKTQGYNPQVWLEYTNAEEGLHYFDGICNYLEKVEVIDHSKGAPMYIRIMDIENYSLDSLYALRELNKGFYDSTRKEHIRCKGFGGGLQPDEQYVTEQYFTLVADAFRGWIDDPMDTLDVTIDAIHVYNDYTEYKITYKEAMPAIFKQILNPNTKDSSVYGQLSNGAYYFLPYMVTETHPRVVDALPFRPDKYTVKPNLEIELEESSQGVKRVFSLCSDNAVLKKYGETVKGLTKELENFNMLYAADTLAGQNTYPTYPKKVARYAGEYRVADTIDKRCHFYFDLPDGSYLFFTYENAFPMEGYTINFSNTINEQAVASLQHKQTPLGWDNDKLLCKQNNIYTIVPMYVQSIHYTEGKLSIMIECVVQFADMPYRVLTLPLCVLGKECQVEMDNYVLYKLHMGVLTIPYTCFKYLDREHTLPEKLKGMNMKVIPQRTYQALYE